MFSDHVITLAGKTITITGHDIFMLCVCVFLGLVFWLAVYFSRKRVVMLKRSRTTDELTFELSRIANALELLANRPANRAIEAATRRQQLMQQLSSPPPQPPPPQPQESQRVSLSMFGR